MGITEILRRIWLFSANKIKSSESFNKQPTQLIIKLNSSLRQLSHLETLGLFNFSILMKVFEICINLIYKLQWCKARVSSWCKKRTGRQERIKPGEQFQIWAKLFVHFLEDFASQNKLRGRWHRKWQRIRWLATRQQAWSWSRSIYTSWFGF